MVSRPGPYRCVRITDPKRRFVAAAPVRDRVVHHALHRVVAPRMDRRFIDHSDACIDGRGSHRAVLRALGGMRRFRYVLALDVHRYVYRIDPWILRELLWRHLREAPLQGLVADILDSGARLYAEPEVAAFLGWSTPGAEGRGLPIGVLRALRVPSYRAGASDASSRGRGRDPGFRIGDLGGGSVEVAMRCRQRCGIAGDTALRAAARGPLRGRVCRGARRSRPPGGGGQPRRLGGKCPRVGQRRRHRGLNQTVSAPTRPSGHRASSIPWVRSSARQALV